MVASDSEAKDIADIMCHWLPSEYALDMVQEIWNDIGMVTENISLRDSILLLMDYLEECAKEIDYDGTEKT
jgi:hypothetical protein